LTFELLHNLVVEMTRLNVEVKNLTMRAESLQSRLEFNERRARALESVVAYKPESERLDTPVPAIRDVPAVAEFRPRSEPPPAPAQTSVTTSSPGAIEGPGQRSRRRRRRRGRRGGGSPGGGGPAMAPQAGQPGAPSDAAPQHDQPTDDAPDSEHGDGGSDTDLDPQ
jgi:hypothetical protein